MGLVREEVGCKRLAEVGHAGARLIGQPGALVLGLAQPILQDPPHTFLEHIDPLLMLHLLHNMAPKFLEPPIKHLAAFGPAAGHRAKIPLHPDPRDRVVDQLDASAVLSNYALPAVVLLLPEAELVAAGFVLAVHEFVGSLEFAGGKVRGLGLFALGLYYWGRGADFVG
jgi:hypothetical protein